MGLPAANAAAAEWRSTGVGAAGPLAAASSCGSRAGAAARAGPRGRGAPLRLPALPQPVSGGRPRGLAGPHQRQVQRLPGGLLLVRLLRGSGGRVWLPGSVPCCSAWRCSHPITPPSPLVHLPATSVAPTPTGNQQRRRAGTSASALLCAPSGVQHARSSGSRSGRREVRRLPRPYQTAWRAAAGRRQDGLCPVILNIGLLVESLCECMPASDL